MEPVSFEDLLATGAHFGHVTRKWHPNYKPYILMEKNGVHIINLEETLRLLGSALDFIREIITRNGEVLFVGTKKQAQDIVQQEADRCGMFYVVERWLGGTLTNFSTIKKSIKRLQLLEKEGSSLYSNLTKKEVQMLNRERIKLADQHRGIKDMKRLPEVVVVVDARYEATAVLEANRLEIPIVALVDSNTDPTTIQHPIPANDDSIRTIQLIVAAIARAIIEARTGEQPVPEAVPEEAVAGEAAPAVEPEKPIAEAAPAEELETTVEAAPAEEPKTPAGETAPAEEPETPAGETAPAEEPETPATQLAEELLEGADPAVEAAAPAAPSGEEPVSREELVPEGERGAES